MNKFRGPVFIAGMPRSGTKLLRDLLNQHPLISIPDVESHFVPGFVERFGKELHITSEKDKVHFYNAFAQTAFFFNNVKKGRPVIQAEFINACDFTSWSTLFRYIAIRYGKNEDREEIIWGDKTPRYLKSLKLLKNVFPESRFIHIIRDPRDYCLSARKIWNKNIYRAAAAWNKGMSQAMEYPAVFGKDYLEVHYEALTTQPEQTLKKICSFLEIDFMNEMLVMKKSHEFYGDAKGSTAIISNSQKYLSELKDEEVRRLESLASPAITHFGYKTLHEVTPSKLSATTEFYYKILDIW
jgi:hypothetical protein